MSKSTTRRNIKSFPVKNDWIHQIQNDLEICGIEESEDGISKMKKSTFKKLVDEKVQQISASYLISLKNKHSKSEHLRYSSSMQPYLKNDELSIEEKKLIFRLNNRLIDVKVNYKKKYKDELEYRLCGYPEESQKFCLMTSSGTYSPATFRNRHTSSEHGSIFLNMWRIKSKKRSQHNET
jgi:hypothetical protein